MRKHQYAFLSGVAALALVAGTSLAAAQNPSGSPSGGSHGNQAQTSRSTAPKGSADHARTQPSSHSGQTAQGGDQGSRPGPKGTGTDQRAQQPDGNNGASSGANHAAQVEHPQAGASRSRGHQTGTDAAAEPRRGHGTAAQSDQRTLRGLQGNARKELQENGGSGTQPGHESGNGSAQQTGQGGNVTLSEQQRTTIRKTVIEARGAPKVGHVDFDVKVGAAVSRSRVHVMSVPETLARIEPRWRGYEYFIYEDEVVIVDPRNMTIVAVLTV
jgi:hypothetical protein